jgi:hypothetical protein
MRRFSYRDLIDRLTNLERLAEPPAAGERSGCFSSYDRRSRYNEETGQYEAWDANNDGSGYIRQEGDGIVAFESEGPGVIWRVWSALPKLGHIRIFIDDKPEPVVDMPFRDFFERFGTEMPPLNFPQLTLTLSRGRNRFIPIPYNRFCKVLLDPDWGAYYHFTYTTFPTDTSLPHYDELFEREACVALAEADRRLARRGWQRPSTPHDSLDQITLTISPGETATVTQLHGNRAITELRLVLDLPEKPADAQILRELALSIKWDGEAEPSVWSPPGDFFGTAPGVNYYRSLPLGMTETSFYCHWFMPFAQSALLAATNDGDEARTLTVTIRHKPLARPADTLLRFHAKWHRDAFLAQVQQNGRKIDWPILLTRGSGRFCGLALHVWNRWSEPEEAAESWWYGRWDKKTIDWWWGEGDEKFFVDSEKFPSTFGTGSEDYIGYAWAAEPPFPTFDSAFACQPWVELNANGHTSVNRFHICDDVPFMTSFEACLEKYKPNQWGEGNVCLYDAVAYWYQRPGEADPYRPIPLSERINYYDVC